jgi:hypothetical protein
MEATLKRKYSVTKAADRKAMAEIVRNILHEANGSKVQDYEFCGPRETGVEFEHLAGLSVTITLDGDDRQDREGTFCMAWHMSTRSPERISDAFGIAMQAPVNQFHHCKCTAFAEGFEDLCAKLRMAVTMLNDGRAYR